MQPQHRVHIAACLALAAAVSPRTLPAQANTSADTSWKAVEQAFGRPGSMQPGGVYKFSMPRSDLTVRVGAVTLKPALALGSWLAFVRNDSGGRATAMGDLVLLESEVASVMRKLQAEGVEQTALHNHLLGESPRVVYMQVMAQGDAVEIARSVREALALTKTPAALTAPASAATAAAFALDTAALARELGYHGKATMLTTPGGRAFLHKLGGAAGDEIVDNYVKVLTATHVTGYPFVTAAKAPNPGSEDAPIGFRVDNAKLLDLNAYLAHLPAPPGAKEPGDAVAAGRETFRSSGCTGCHNVDQSKPVPAVMVPMIRIFPGDRPVVLAQREPPLNPIENTPGSVFDDKMAVVNASLRGDVRGTAMPLLLDLARKPVFLHDNSVPTLDALLDGSRGPDAPHPFYVRDAGRRARVTAYLRSLSDQ